MPVEGVNREGGAAVGEVVVREDRRFRAVLVIIVAVVATEELDKCIPPSVRRTRHSGPGRRWRRTGPGRQRKGAEPGAQRAANIETRISCDLHCVQSKKSPASRTVARSEWCKGQIREAGSVGAFRESDAHSPSWKAKKPATRVRRRRTRPFPGRLRQRRRRCRSSPPAAPRGAKSGAERASRTDRRRRRRCPSKEEQRTSGLPGRSSSR